MVASLGPVRVLRDGRSLSSRCREGQVFIRVDLWPSFFVCQPADLLPNGGNLLFQGAAGPGDAAELGGGMRQTDISSPAAPETPGSPNPGTGEAATSAGPTRFQYSALKAIPHSHFQQRKDWYENTDQDLRDYVVQRLVHAIFPATDLAVLKDHQVEKVVSYAKKVEGDVYQSTNHWDVYCCLIMVKLFSIEKQLREKRALRGQKTGREDDQASPAGQTQPLISQLAAPEVPLSPIQDPPGVSQLNPMSIWTIQNSPASMDAPAASPLNPPVQMQDEEAALMDQDPGSPLSYSVAPPPPHASPGAQSQRPPLGSMAAAAAAPGLSPELQQQQQPKQSPPPCPKSAPTPGPPGDPHFGNREAACHGLLGKRRRLAEAGWRASPAGPSPSAPPEAAAQPSPSPVTLESLHRSLEDLRISVLRNLGAVHRQVEALEKRINTLERWRAEMEGRQQPSPPQP